MTKYHFESRSGVEVVVYESGAVTPLGELEKHLKLRLDHANRVVAAAKEYRSIFWEEEEQDEAMDKMDDAIAMNEDFIRCSE